MQQLRVAFQPMLCLFTERLNLYTFGVSLYGLSLFSAKYHLNSDALFKKE